MEPSISDDYVTLFLNSAFATGNPFGPLTLLLLFMSRILPIIAQSPFFGGRVLPHPVKVAFALSLFIVFLPHLLYVTTTPLGFTPMTIVYFAKEVFIGYILGFFISIPFAIVQNAGMLIDHQRGGASLMVNDPTIQNQSSPLGTVFNMVLIFLFFYIDAPFLFIDAIITSYEIVPPDQFINPFFFDKSSAFGATQLVFFNKVMKLSVQLATPALMAILMTDVFLGIANRLAPQVQITFLGLPLKSLLGLTAVCIGWQLLTSQMVRETYGWLNYINEIIIMFKNPEFTPQ